MRIKTRIKTKRFKNLTIYIPELKEDKTFSFFNKWKPLSLFLLENNIDDGMQPGIKFWSEDLSEIEETIKNLPATYNIV